MDKTTKPIRRRWNIFLLIGAFYWIILILTSLFVCALSYEQKKSEILADVNIRLTQVGNAYQNLTEQFWESYLPIFENRTTSYLLLRDYFAVPDDDGLTPVELHDISNVLAQIVVRDDRIQWIAAYSSVRKVNYIYYAASQTGTGVGIMEALPDDFPYMEQMQQKNNLMEIYGEIESERSQLRNTIAVAGGTPALTKGVLLFGYGISQIQQFAEENLPLESLQFEIISNEGRLLYHSGEEHIELPEEIFQAGSGVFQTDTGKWYAMVDPFTTRGGTVYYTIDWKELFLKSNASTPQLLTAILQLSALSILVLCLVMRTIQREARRIRDGLDALGQNQLDYRIGGNFYQAAFADIAHSINKMAESLKENIDKAYYYQLKHKEAEMQELQAKFNPHFLYNSLDVFRARCYENGDDETAELIAQTASVFRGFIGAQTFIPLQQELAFSQRYLAIYRARHNDAMQILYDIDKEVLQYGIIRNVLQPLIENYFAHGFDPSRQDNILQFRGYIRDEDTYVLTVEDNGFGMEEDALQALNAHLQEPIATEQESYGLKNLHQRIQLYYGPKCGLVIRKNPTGGLIAELCVLRKKPEENAE
ncbi:histidine kinase [Faecalibacterium sp. AF27-11BH]|uniref:sensor histidine kinase n=1 Tax=Faecalibacterium sp. AF27-11BH TaxID=2302956 RepID=UPI000E747127|nr:histidine kinase [Faecalibacterium sp. AF27-11BH]RJV79348.1 hypothetical protein DWY76_01100 [Faecalibacterium sp. AF27-11BH]